MLVAFLAVKPTLAWLVSTREGVEGCWAVRRLTGLLVAFPSRGRHGNSAIVAFVAVSGCGGSWVAGFALTVYLVVVRSAEERERGWACYSTRMEISKQLSWRLCMAV